MTASVNFTVANTTDWRLTLNMTRDGVSWDLSGYTARMQMRASATADKAAADLSTEQGTIVLTGSALKIIYPRGLSLGVEAGAYVYDIILESSAERVRAIAGTVTVLQGVTR